MQIEYDPQADAIYIQLQTGDVDDTLQTGKYVFVDVDKNGLPLGIEILFASRVLAQQEMIRFTVTIAHPIDGSHSPLATP